MKRKGYIFSLFVFFMFVSVFIVAATHAKSVSVLEESNYDRVSLMKASNVIRNLRNAVDYGTLCAVGVDASGSPVASETGAVRTVEDAGMPFEIDVGCSLAVATVTVTTPAGDEYVLKIPS